MSALLHAENVSAGYGTRRVVDGVSLTVRPGELWAILGPNGAGKSTFLKTCLGLVPLSGGSVSVLDRPLSSWSRRELAQKIAWVPQAAEMDDGFSAFDLVLMGRAPHHGGLALPSRADVERAHGVLAELGISSLAERSLSALSGGERRLLLLARALVQDPALLFLDEPTAFLDLRHQVEVLDRVRARVRGGLGAIAVLHDVNLAAVYADRVLMIQDGKTLATGVSAELLVPEMLERLFQMPMVGTVSEAGQKLFGPRPRS